MPRKQGLGRKHKKGTGIYKGEKHERARVNVTHPQPYSLMPLKPNDSVALLQLLLPHLVRLNF
jgi:hypothetical protein